MSFLRAITLAAVLSLLSAPALVLAQGTTSVSPHSPYEAAKITQALVKLQAALE